MKSMIIVFSNLASEKYPLGLIHRLFGKLEIPGAQFISEDRLFIPDPIDPENLLTSPCWKYGGAVQSKGYGVIEFNGKTRTVHRLMYDIWNNDLAQNLQVHHSCNCRNCVNIFHLSQGTNRENIDYMLSLDRQAFGERCGNHKLTEEQVLCLYDDIKNGNCTKQQMAQKFGVSLRNIYHILEGDCWKHTLQNRKLL
jgi:hypothetical protein